MQDPSPMPWGALDRYQAHFIVRKEIGVAVADHLARTKLTTKGHFAAKKVVKVEWDGSGVLASRLNADTELNSMIVGQSYHDATIYVEPTDGAVRIRNKWKNHLDFGITRELFDIYDRIAGHIKQI